MSYDDKQKPEEGVRMQAMEQELPFFTPCEEAGPSVSEPVASPTNGAVVEQDLFGKVYIQAPASDEALPNDKPYSDNQEKAAKEEGEKEKDTEPSGATVKERHPFRGRPMKRRRESWNDELPGTKKYLSKINTDTLETITLGVIDLLMMKKGYKDKKCSARQLAVSLHTNTRYISIAISRRFHVNYSTLVNKLRVEEAMSMLVDRRYKDYRMEDISDTVGFANRQTFNAAFLKHCGMTPSQYAAKVDRP